MNYLNKTVSGRYVRELKNKGRSRVGQSQKWSGSLIMGVVAIAYESFSLLTKLKSQFKREFTKAVVTRAGRLREWSQGKLWLYYNKTWTKLIHSKRALSLIFCHLHVHFITCWPTYIQDISRQPTILNIVNWSVRKTRPCSSVIFRVDQEITFFRSYT